MNSGQTRTLLLTGNIHDLFHLHSGEEAEYVPLLNLLLQTWNVPGRILLIYELNGPIRFLTEEDRNAVRDAWLKWRTGLDANELAIQNMLSSGKTLLELKRMSKAFDENLEATIGKPTLALELFRQMCICSRTRIGGKPLLRENLIILIEAADMLIPEGEIVRLSDTDRHRISICQDWFSDIDFINGDDSVVMIAESRSLINHRIARLPQIIEVGIPSPDEDARTAFIRSFNKKQSAGQKLKVWGSQKELAQLTAGLSIHALMQLLKDACHRKESLKTLDVVTKVEEYIQSQLGEDLVEFKKPEHTLNDVIGFRKLKAFLKEELIPRFRSSDIDALPGAAVCGPIGSGKTFIFEALASELDMVVIVLKNIRSQWFGQTDVLLERLRRVLNVLAKVLIFVDEADTQFGGIGVETHSTERRLTGKIQAMMSDPRLRGRVIWLLMTARIHMLSPDLRRPGRVGDLIIPVLDPEGADREEFLDWAVAPFLERASGKEKKTLVNNLDGSLEIESAAGFARLRSELKAKTVQLGRNLTIREMQDVAGDLLPAAIHETRRYQTLQALVNCTRRSLLPESVGKEPNRETWAEEIRALEARGIR